MKIIKGGTYVANGWNLGPLLIIDYDDYYIITMNDTYRRSILEYYHYYHDTNIPLRIFKTLNPPTK